MKKTIKQEDHVRHYKSGKRSRVNPGLKKIVKRKPNIPKTQSSFRHPVSKGWLVPYLRKLDYMTNQRWYFRSSAIVRNKIVLPIPQINFSTPKNESTMKMLKNCLETYHSAHLSTRKIDLFFDWILWGFNSSLIKKFPDIKKELSEHWYKTFDLGLLLKHPHDYPARILEYVGSKGGPGWFATPMNINCMMQQIVQGKETKPWQSTNDPCMGTGSMLLPLSNQSLNITGGDISGLMVKAAHINFTLYVPWVMMPFSKYMLARLKEEYESITANEDFKKLIKLISKYTKLDMKNGYSQDIIIGKIQRESGMKIILESYVSIWDSIMREIPLNKAARKDAKRMEELFKLIAHPKLKTTKSNTTKISKGAIA